jgi:response regulator RpfG family c-di-GMP phosphodiesterase
MFNERRRQEMSFLTELGDQETKTRLDLLYEVGKKVGSVTQLSRLLDRVTQMTQRTLNASASSVLLLDGQGRDLVFEVAWGQAGKQLRQATISTRSGIAGWVARHGKPLIVNDVRQDERFNRGIDAVTGFVTRSVICAPLVVHRKIIGVIEVLNKLDGSDFNEQDLEVLAAVASTNAMAIENTRLHQMIMEAYKGTIKALAAAIDAKDPYTCGHSQRVMEYALLGGKELSFSEDELEVLEYAGILHDIGKIGIADSILSKPEALSPEEWHIMHKHPQIGAHMLEGIPFLEKARELILHHHERYDGKGYPDGLKGEEIPIGARLLAVADAFDTMVTERSYRIALSADSAMNELYRFSGTQFCPVAIEAFISGFRTNGRRLYFGPTPEPWQLISA